MLSSEVPYNGTDNNDYVDGQGFCCDDGSPEAAQARARHWKTTSRIRRIREVAVLLRSRPLGVQQLHHQFGRERWFSTSRTYRSVKCLWKNETNIRNTPYLFNAKEFDEETGSYYDGAEVL